MSDNISLKKELDAFVQRTLSIRRLSSPDVNLATNPGEYSTILKRNFKNIGSIATDNRKMLESYIDPILKSDEPLSDDVVVDLQDFVRFLLNPWPEEELDLTLLFLVSKRLLDDAIKKQDDDYIIRECGTHIYACYNNMDRVNRLRVSEKLTAFYVKEGLSASDILLPYLKKESFEKISESSREAVITHSRFYAALYDTCYTTDETTNQKRIDALITSIELYDDPFYVKLTPNYDWRRHLMRCMEHMSQLTENGNQWRLSEAQCMQVASYTQRLKEMWDEDPKNGEEIVPKVHLDLLTLRNSYYSGSIDLKKYRDNLLFLYERFASNKYDMYGVLANVFIPTEYMATVTKDTINEDSYDTLAWLYRSVTKYILHSKNSESFSFLLEYLTSFLERFVEIPGEITYEQMGLECMAALHPPTYVHSLQVGAIARCICEHMIKKNPAALIGVIGTKSEDEVRERSSEIIHRIYHGALCHDFGKICMMDTVFIYWRCLYDEDFDIIKIHPETGAMQLSRYSSTAGYCDIAMGHHVWYDGSRGYPYGFDISASDQRQLIGIVSIADSIDAATDHIGRSFKESPVVTPKKLMDEFKEGSGTRYFPEAVELIATDRELQADIDFILHQSRDENYKYTYLHLSRVERKASHSK